MAQGPCLGPRCCSCCSATASPRGPAAAHARLLLPWSRAGRGWRVRAGRYGSACVPSLPSSVI